MTKQQNEKLERRSLFFSSSFAAATLPTPTQKEKKIRSLFREKKKAFSSLFFRTFAVHALEKEKERGRG